MTKIMASLDWRGAFGVNKYDRDFVPEELTAIIRRTLMGDQHPKETAHCVAVQVRTLYADAMEAEICYADQKQLALQKMNEFLLSNMVVTTPQYKRAFLVLRQNQTTAQRNHERLLQQIEKLRIVLETAISVALSYVDHSHGDQHNSSGDEEGVWDDESQSASQSRRDEELFGPYLHLVRDMPNRRDIPRW
jgi:hypothetical protein